MKNIAVANRTMYGKKSIYFSLLCLVVLTLLFTGGCASKFEGNVSKNENAFCMEYQTLNMSDQMDMKLFAGDNVHVEIINTKGNISIKIASGNELPIYQGNQITASGSFDVIAQTEGIYTITVTGKQAQGSVSFTKITG